MLITSETIVNASINSDFEKNSYLQKDGACHRTFWTEQPLLLLLSFYPGDQVFVKLKGLSDKLPDFMCFYSAILCI